MGLRGMRVRKSPLVWVLYAEATRPFPVNAKGVGPQTTHKQHWVDNVKTNCIKVTKAYQGRIPIATISNVTFHFSFILHIK